MKSGLLLLSVFLIFASCANRRKQEAYRKDPRGFYYQLIDFESRDFFYQPGRLAHLAVSFCTERDSVFWNSSANMHELFFVRIDSSSRSSFLQAYASRCSEGDSSTLLVPAATFFEQQFSQDVPSFAVNDSIIKIHLRVKKILGYNDWLEFTEKDPGEQERISAYLKQEGLSPEIKADESGIIWLEGMDEKDGISVGATTTIEYQGRFLDGRPLEAAPQQMQFVFGSPDQVLPGLNIVIGRLKVGENAKIILPSRLAFGEEGSSDGRVPPRTPLMYDITIIQ